MFLLIFVKQPQGIFFNSSLKFKISLYSYRELEKTRVEPLIRLIEKAKKVRDADLVTFFDDLYDLGGEEEKSFTAVNVSGDSATSAEEQPRVSDEDRRPKPRRVRTYHGATDKRKSKKEGENF